MGNHNSKQLPPFADWEKLETENGTDIYQNKKNNSLAEKRSITIDPQFDLDHEFKIYHMR
jgi:hypothetical protein